LSTQILRKVRRYLTRSTRSNHIQVVIDQCRRFGTLRAFLISCHKLSEKDIGTKFIFRRAAAPCAHESAYAVFPLADHNAL